MLLWSALMARYRQAFLFAVLLGVALFVQPQPHAQTQTDVTGEWEASYQTPLGPQELKIYLTQEGPRISGHTSSEYGESQVRGTINSQDIQFAFQSTDGGRAIDVRVTAKVEGERMRGTAKIGDRAEGAFTAERTASTSASLHRATTIATTAKADGQWSESADVNARGRRACGARQASRA